MFHNFPETVKNIELLCQSAKIPFTIPENQTCCGLPYFEKGELKTAKTVAEYNLGVFGESDVICTSLKCKDTFTVKYPKIFNNTVSHNQSVRLANATKGLDYLFDKANPEKAELIAGKYFFIPDCAIEKNIQLDWISRFKNAEFHFAKLENTCCGAGYCLPSTNKTEADKMTSALIHQAIETGSESIVTTNEICLQQIIHVINANNHILKAKHLIDLYAEAL